MKKENLANALNEIKDEYILEAVQVKKKRHPWRWVGAVAAVLAVTIALTAVLWPAAQPQPALHTPLNTTGKVPESTPYEPIGTSPVPVANLLVAKPEYPEMAAYPQDPNNTEASRLWKESRNQQYDQPEGYGDSLQEFFAESIPVFLDNGTQNAVYSPVNVYMALAMLAETAGGETRQEILDALGVDSIEALREQAGHMWNAHYSDDGLTKLLLANSLWLDDALPYNQSTADTLAKDYYASVFHGDLGTEEINQALRQWLNENTGNLLREQVAGVELDPYAMLVLASTIYYKAQWKAEFNEELTKEDVFYSPQGEQTVSYLCRTIDTGNYYAGEDYGAVPVSLEDGSVMWLILPNEGLTPQDILQSGHALADLLGEGGSEKSTLAEIHLQLPKFDVVSQTDLRQGLQKMGLDKVFIPEQADFSGITDQELYLAKADHAARVTIDEKGIEAAAYTILAVRATGMGPQLEEIDFVLDRPFLFVIESASGMPLFTGVVNEP